MSRTKGAHGKHKKEKPVKEKKKRGRPSKNHQKQYQHQTVNVNVNSDGGGSSRKPQLPVQIPTTIFDPSLLNQHYGINDRQPVNPPTNTNPDMITPFLQAMIANQKQNQQQQITPQPTPQPTQPTPIKPIKPTPQPIKPQPIKPQPENPQIILPTKPEKPSFTYEDVQHLIDEIHQKQKKEIPEPIPQNEPKKPPQDTLGLTINDKYDGLKMKNKTIPWSEVADGVSKGVIGGVAVGVAGPSLLNAAITSAAGTIGYQIGGTPGALIGGAVGSKFSEKINNAYQTTTKQNESSISGYEEIPNNSNRVNGGTVVVTRKTQQREPSKQKKMLISRLGDAIKDITPSNRAPPSQKIKESKLLKDIEQQQRTYGTIQPSDIEPQDPKPSTITQLTEGVKDIYRRLSGKKKGQYTQLPTSDPDFKTTLESSKREGQKQGTYAILPQEEMDFETEMEAMR
jgi:hypothetical protein